MPAQKRKSLSGREIRIRAARIKLILTDSDGVLTDTGVYYGESGEMFKRFSIRDGMGVERLRARGIETAILTGETSGSVRTRAAKLQMKFFYPGVKDKRAHLAAVLEETGLTPQQIGYIGDDMNDLEIMRELRGAGITAAPGDAMPEISVLAHYRCKNRGGHGAFREFAEWLIALREKPHR
jgi:3-deoxy-D-manno-octulosonate 8-phosphate phosphatase (KDO 8-P phosphatase)